MKDLLSQTLCLTIVLSLYAIARSEEWTQYRGLMGDGKSSEQLGTVNWEQGPNILWKADTPLGFSSFSVADKRAFTLVARPDSAGELVETCIALDANSGDEIWSVPLGPAEYGHDGGNAGTGDNRGGDGPRSTPSTDGKNVFVYDSHLGLYCFDALNGQQVWKQDIAEDFSGRNISWLNATSPLVVEDVIYVAGGGEGQTFLAFDKNTGENLWKSGDAMLTHATPAYSKVNGADQLVFFMQSGLVGIEPRNGTELWRTDFEFRVSSAASPLIDDSLVYCSAGYSVGAGLFSIAKDNSVEQQWLQKNKLMNHWSTPVLHQGHLYGIFEFKKYGRAPLQCVELATGEIKWSQRGFGPGNCILVGESLVVLSDAGEVVIVDAKPDSYRETARAKVVDGKCWSTPAFSNGKIYVRSTQEAACVLVR